ncbi:hypothetical protein LIER_00345 [Lithospermum erythrorhizon]|uniref:Uncharacterized protein n=1 Tax=Lithospermum erythrorhizon TaxID=34254 RepID=A0AAV3NH55_LITER
MTGDRVPLFRRARVVKKSSNEPGVSARSVLQPAAAQTSSISKKRPAPNETRPKLFSKRQKSNAHKLSRSDILDLIEDIPSSTLLDKEIIEDSNLWKKSDAFHAARPLLLERIEKEYASIKDPLQVHGALTRHLIKALNASYEIARRADLLDDAHDESCEKEIALQLQVKELKEENERLKATSIIAIKKKKEATSQALAEIKKHDALQARFASRFTKTCKDVNSSIVANYQDFIQVCPKKWFAPLDLSAALTPISEEEEGEDPSAPADASAS